MRRAATGDALADGRRHVGARYAAQDGIEDRGVRVAVHQAPRRQVRAARAATSVHAVAVDAECAEHRGAIGNGLRVAGPRILSGLWLLGRGLKGKVHDRAGDRDDSKNHQSLMRVALVR